MTSSLMVESGAAQRDQLAGWREEEKNTIHRGGCLFTGVSVASNGDGNISWSAAPLILNIFATAAGLLLSYHHCC